MKSNIYQKNFKRVTNTIKFQEKSRLFLFEEDLRKPSLRKKHLSF